MARKRAPGGGRKPTGPFRGKSATLTTRITPATRAELDREAKKKDRSLSQEVEIRLTGSLASKQRETPIHTRAIAHAITLLAGQIERETGKRWSQDPYTGIALRHGIERLIFHFAPTSYGAPVVPPRIKEVAAKLQPNLRESYLRPELLGVMQAGTIITMIEHAPEPPVRKLPEGIEFPKELYANWQILRGLGSGWQRNRKVWNKETKE